MEVTSTLKASSGDAVSLDTPPYPYIAECNEDGQFMFVGDTNVRQLFWATASKLDSLWVSERQQELDKHEDLHLEVGRARVSFLWDPFLNGTGFKEELKAYMERNRPENSVEEKKLHPSNGKRRSVLLFVGGGLFHARHLGDEYLPAFNHVVDRVAAVMSTTHDRLTSPGNIRAHGKDGVDDQIFFAPVPDPIVDRLSPSREVTITQNKVWAMNDHLQLWSNRGLNVPWAYREMTSGWPETVGESGVHVTNRIAKQMANVVLNYRCNAKSAQKHGYPFSKTCCSAYRPANWIQTIATILFAPLAALLVTRWLHSPEQKSRIAVLADALAVLMLAVVYCFITDRTHVFDKIPKEFANSDFRVMLGVAVLLCLLSIQSVPTQTSSKSRKRLPESAVQSQPFLPREVSDEFKGWMQIYVLVYAYTGAFDVLDFYKVFRIFIALYLLLSGYGHASYFLRTNDITAQRVLGVVLRINTLSVLLALATDRPYTSYSFAPLVTFWFLIVFLTLRIGRQWNSSLGLLLVKVLLAALLTTMFIHAQGFLELWASLFSIMFQASINTDDMRFHLGVDKYVIFVGIIVAAVETRIQSVLQRPYKQLDDFEYVIKWHFVKHQVLLIAFAIMTVPIFLVSMQRARTMDAYEWWVPYTAWLPALSFIILRNATAYLRARYCASFAWLGRISLELYILSQHIWLAGDGRGVLRIGLRYGSGTLLGDRWRDLIILTPIFVWMAWKVHEATKVTTAWLLLGPDAAEDRQQHEGAANEEAMELPGWHRPESNITDGIRENHKAQHGERKMMLIRVGSLAMAIWLVNLWGSVCQLLGALSRALRVKDAYKHLCGDMWRDLERHPETSRVSVWLIPSQREADCSFVRDDEHMAASPNGSIAA
ncbi:hypothetical protein N0V91_002053 [Didymella pomorum]|uniref:Cas1p 10 TM acyl transferase domain-containing protein n=1 Tax=Didymella pomorum TaxID=749634 RepID=A0A9W8ZJ04_9PLEO|nr:hypothetical protein N0V91_002053 [Didymella pomorum]